MNIKRFDVSGCGNHNCDPLMDSRYGSYVEYDDHISSHAYDEAKERELFESRWSFTNEEQEIYFVPELNIYSSKKVSQAADNKSSAWYWWQACAKSRSGIRP